MVFLSWQHCLCTWSPSKRWLLFQMAARKKLKKHKRECSWVLLLLFPFHKREGAQGQCVSCSKMVSAASGRKENCIGISRALSLCIPDMSLKLSRALNQLLRSQGHFTRTICSDFLVGEISSACSPDSGERGLPPSTCLCVCCVCSGEWVSRVHQPVWCSQCLAAGEGTQAGIRHSCCSLLQACQSCRWVAPYCHAFFLSCVPWWSARSQGQEPVRGSGLSALACISH